MPHILLIIVFHASNMIGSFGLAMAGIGILIFTLLFTLMIPGGTSKAAIMMPLMAILAVVSGVFVSILAAVQWVG